jgi:hypothetical protein
MEQLHQPQIGIELPQRRHRSVVESRVGVMHQPLESGFFDASAEERGHDANRGLCVGQAAQGLQFIRTEMWPGFRNIETAIRGHAGQQNLVEFQNRGIAPCADISHAVRPLFFERPN